MSNLRPTATTVRTEGFGEREVKGRKEGKRGKGEEGRENLGKRGEARETEDVRGVGEEGRRGDEWRGRG